MNTLATLHTYRGYVWRNAVNEVRYRYAGSGMGLFWHVINPALQATVYGVLFGALFSATERAGWLHLCLGLLPWLAFSEALARASHCFVRGAGAVRTASVPLEVLVTQEALASLFSGLLAASMLLLVVGFLGPGLHRGLLLFLLAVFLFHAFAWGLSLVVATLGAFFTDTAQVVRVLSQLWMWTVPVVYPEHLLPEPLRAWLFLNPAHAFVSTIRSLGLGQPGPGAGGWLELLLWVGLAATAGLFCVRRLRSDVLDVL